MDTKLQIVLAAKDISGTAFKKVQGKIASLSKAVFSLQGVMVGAAGAAGLGYFVKKQLEAADNIAKTADTIGISTKSLQEYRFMADRAGVATAMLDQGFGAFTKRLGELKLGTGALNTILNKNNKALKEQLIAARSTDEALNIFVDALAKVESQSGKAALSAAAFSRTAGIKLTNLVKGGAGSVAELRSEFERLGLEIDENLLRSAEDTIDRFTDLEYIIKQRLMTTVLEFAPEISAVAENMTEWVVANDKLFKQDVPRYLEDIGKVAKVVVGAVSGIVNKFEQIGTLMENIEYFFTDDKVQYRLDQLSELAGGSSIYTGESKNTGELGTPTNPDSLNITKNFFEPFETNPLEEWVYNGIQAMERLQREVEKAVNGVEISLSEMEIEFRDEAIRSDLDSFFSDLEEDAEEASTFVSDAFAGWAGSFGSDLVDMAWGAEITFKDIAESFSKMLIKMYVQKKLMEPMLSLFDGFSLGGLLKSFGGFLAGGLFAGGGGGGVPNMGNAIHMAGGGVINEHVMGVGMSSGRSYEFGERGSEAVIPSGFLSSNQEKSSNYNITINAVDSKSFNDMLKEHPGTIVGAIEGALTGNTGLRQTMRSTM